MIKDKKKFKAKRIENAWVTQIKGNSKRRITDKLGIPKTRRSEEKRSKDRELKRQETKQKQLVHQMLL